MAPLSRKLFEFNLRSELSPFMATFLSENTIIDLKSDTLLQLTAKYKVLSRNQPILLILSMSDMSLLTEHLTALFLVFAFLHKSLKKPPNFYINH